MDTPIVVALIMAASAIVGGLVTFLSTRGKTKTDARAALDQRIDERLESQLTEAWARMDSQQRQIDAQDAKINELKTQRKTQARLIENLQEQASVAERREALIYQHTRALRDHIINKLPPPPPTMPLELQRWFEQFESITQE